jgi:hypothetical protein
MFAPISFTVAFATASASAATSNTARLNAHIDWWYYSLVSQQCGNGRFAIPKIGGKAGEAVALRAM